MSLGAESLHADGGRPATKSIGQLWCIYHESKEVAEDSYKVVQVHFHGQTLMRLHVHLPQLIH